MRPPPLFLSTPLLLWCLAPIGGRQAAAQESGPQDLREMQAALARHRTLHLRVRIDELRGVDRFRYYTETWIDLEQGRLRVEVGEEDRPLPYRTTVLTPTELVIYHADARQKARRPGSLPLARGLEAAGAGELLQVLFAGQLVSMRGASYRPPRRISGENPVGETPCQELAFDGNQTTHLWLGLDDSLPRRLSGPMPDHVRDEVVEWLELDVDLGAATFELHESLVAPTLSYLQAQKAWRHLPPQSSRWPKAGSEAPPFAAVDLEGHAQRFEPAAGAVHLLAFWFRGNPAGIERLVAAEKLWRERGGAPREMLSVHFGAQRGPVGALWEQRGLSHRCWLVPSSGDSDNAFHRYWIASCPVFFVLESDGTIRGATRDLAELATLLRD